MAPRFGPSTTTSRSRSPAARTVSLRASPTRRSMTGFLLVGQLVRPIQQLAASIYELFRLVLADARATELRPFQKADHLGCEGVALARKRDELILEVCVGAVVRRAAAVERA